MVKPRHDWYVSEWLAYFGKKQADIVNDLDWNKARISLMASGKQPYNREAINDIAAYLHLEPFEMLLPPERAMAIRQMRASAEQIVTLAHENEPIDLWAEKLAREAQEARPRTPKKGTGTDG